jgi:eukaryotic-like serine/threonine-protein kinase
MCGRTIELNVNKSSTETNLDSIFGRLVIERNLCTPDELQECMNSLRQSVQQQGSRAVALSDMLVEKGYVTRNQIERVRKSAEEYRPAAHQIPGFQIQKKLGAGAMAVVYKAKQISLDRTVAVKVLPKRLSENQEYVERFYKEGRAAAKLNHNNIVQAIDVGEATGVHFFVMEYVEGKTVYDDIAKGKAYSETEALDIVIQIADALQHAHERGLIHRDVKPKNIMITKDGVAKLADMGLAREVGDQAAAQMEEGRAYGTPYYIAPEQIRGELDIDQRADIYSLGATFYHMITGRVPFDGPTPSAVMHKHLKEPLIPPDHLNPALSVGVAEVVEVMMAKKRTDRYSSAKLLLEDLRAVRAGEPPMIAHQKFDSSVLADLEKGKASAYDEDDIERAMQQTSGQVGMKIAVVILSGLLLISLLAILILLLNKP